MNVYNPFLVPVSTAVLSGMFGMLVVGINTTIFGMLLDKITLKIGLGMTMVSGVILQKTFLFCCHIFEDFRAIRDAWNKSASFMKDAGYMRSVAKSLRPFAIPAGEVGIFDRDIKMNYINQVIYVTITLLVGKEVFLSLNCERSYGRNTHPSYHPSLIAIASLLLYT